MSRRRTKAEEIRNPEHYFNRYIACERKKEQEEDAEYYDLHESLDSMVERAFRDGTDNVIFCRKPGILFRSPGFLHSGGERSL